MNYNISAKENSLGPSSNIENFLYDDKFIKNRAMKHYLRAKNNIAFNYFVSPLLECFHMTENDLIREYLRYNLNINEETNDTYQLIGTQFALLINYIPENTWFSNRRTSYIKFTDNFKKIADIGFGIPFPWLELAKRKSLVETHFTLIDDSQSALDFAKEFIELALKHRPEAKELLQYNLQLYSIENSASWDLIDAEAIVMLDCIEHANNPQASLRRIANKYNASTFLIGLPVGTPIPQHVIDFDTPENVEDFVRGAGMKITRSDLISANWSSDIVGNPEFLGSLFIEAQ